MRGTLQSFRRGRTLAGPHFGRPGVPPPTETSECPSRAGLGPAPTTYSEAILSWFGWGRPLSLPPSIDHVPLARHSQAQKWSRTRSNFPQTQGPMARKEPLTATQILRAGNVLLTSRGNPRNGGPGGKRSYGHEVPVGRVPRRSFGFFPIAGKETRPAGRNSLAKRTFQRPEEGIGLIGKKSSGERRGQAPALQRCGETRQMAKTPAKLPQKIPSPTDISPQL